MGYVLKFIEAHPAFVTIVIFLLGGIGFLIRHFFFSEKKVSAPYIKSGGDISAGGDIVVGNKTVNQPLSAPAKNIEAFEKLLEHSSWRKELIDHKEVWFCDKDNTYQIEIGDRAGEWQEKWAKVYPDANSSKYPVYLKINNVMIKELAFISCDGGRIFVPLPELRSAGDGVTYVWKRNSLPYKVCQIIGQYYIHHNIEGVAQMSKISII